jgi:hypothetical protein
MMADNSIQLQLIDKKEPMQRFLYNEAYKFWQAQWTETIEELGLEGLSVKHSDKFLTADKIIVFRQGVNIAALGLINYIDLQLLASRFLSYFDVMPEESMTFILNQGHRKVMTSTYNIVAKQYRRIKVGNIVLAIALPGAILKLFQCQSDLDLCLGLPSLASANHRTLSRLGMRNLPGGLISIYNVKAQFMYVNQGEVDLGKYDLSINSLLSNNLIAA